MRIRAHLCVIGYICLGALLSQGEPAASTNQPPTLPTPDSLAGVKATGGTNAPYKIPENRIMEFAVPLSQLARLTVIKCKNPPVEFAKAAIAVPAGFDPEIPTQILLINGTSDGDGSSIRPMHAFTNVALRMGWVVMAAEGPIKPTEDNPPWRWAMISALLEHVNKAWPGAKRWPIAAAGVSGGGKWAGIIGGILAQKEYKLIGVFMGAVNEDYASEAAKLYDPAVNFKQVPIYLSSGQDDKLATPEHHQQVKESLLHNGFANVRLESFKGGHALSEGELRKALTWFIDHYGKDETEPGKPDELK